MDTGYLNLLLNLVTVVVSGGALGIILRYRQGMRGLANTDTADIRDHYAEEVKSLRSEVVAARSEVAIARKELADCEEECRTKIREIERELWGEKRQRVAEQISLINLILQSVDAPALKTLLRALESARMQIPEGQVG